jgi:hypothetical protein
VPSSKGFIHDRCIVQRGVPVIARHAALTRGFIGAETRAFGSSGPKRHAHCLTATTASRFAEPHSAARLSARTRAGAQGNCQLDHTRTGPGSRGGSARLNGAC